MAPVKPTPEMTHDHGIIAKLYPLPSWEVDAARPTSSACSSAAAATSAREFPEIGLPDSNGELERIEEPGRPDLRQSNRGPGTGLRVSIPILNITKTRLNDPFTWFMGTNDNPGDYRNSGCASCHVIYANNRDIEASRPLRQVRQSRHERERRSDHPQGPVGASAAPRDDQRDPDRAVHDLPHAPAEPLHEHVARLHHVGLRDAAPEMWPEEAATSIGGRRQHKCWTAIPRARRCAASGRAMNFRRGERAQSQDQGHAVRRLSRPRLELPRRLQA